jgi:hypothetical protein
MQDFRKYLKRSQIYLFAWIIVACFLASSVVITQGGVSNFGMHYSTLPFYTLAFVGGAVNIWFAANTLRKTSRKYKTLAIYLNVLSVLLILVFVTTFPRRFGDVYSDIHDNISKGLFVYELILAGWLVKKRPTLDVIGYFFIMLGGSLIGLLSSMHILHLMFIGQMTGALGFALLLVFALPKVIEKDTK